MTNFTKKVVWAVLLGAATVLALTFLADFRAVAEALGNFKIIYLPLILGLTLVNYLLRFSKWQFFLRQIGVVISLKDSLLIFFSGLAMTLTPGKAGELLKSVLLKELNGAAVSRTAPVVFAERLSDGFGLIILSLAGAAMFRYGKAVLLVTALLLAVMVLMIRIPLIYNGLLKLWARTPGVKRFTGIFETLMQSAGRLLTLPALLFTVLLSVVSWAFEGVAFYIVFTGLGYQVSCLAAVSTLAFSAVVGAVSMLPGGLGAAEGSLMGLLVKVIGVPTNIAAVATIIIRFCTLWFGVAVGLVALAANRRLLGFVNQVSPAGAGKEAGDGREATEVKPAGEEKGTVR